MQQTNYDDNHKTKRPRLDFADKPPPPTKKPRLDCEENTNKPIRHLDEFEMLSKIGEGTYGVVYRAKDKKTTEIVAVKKLKTSMLADRKKLGFRLPETEILTSLTHPSIIDLKHVVAGSHVGSLFMVMEYVENDLKSLLSAKKQPFTLSQIKCLMQQLLQGVAYLHRNQIHRMRIQDKYKSKPRPSSGGGGSVGSGDGIPNTTVPKPTPSTPVINIHACVESGDLIGLQRLLGQDPSSLNERSTFLIQTPLHIAANQNRVDIMKYLLDWNGPGTVELEANNVYGETPLHEAAKNGCNDAVRMLLQYGANVEATTNNSMTPLHLAVGYALRCGDNSVVKTLSEYNANFSAEDDEGMIPFNYLPSGVENNELMQLCQNLAEQMNNVTQQINTFTEQIYYTSTSTSSTTLIEYQHTEEEPQDFDTGIKGKMEEFDYQLSKIVGLHDLKLQLQRWAKGMILDEKRRAMGIDLGPKKPPHMAFLGNPGTGKTTVARILGKLLCSVGVLSSDNVTEVQRTDLVGEFLGQTGPKTRKKIEEAMGGILFVDEAYRLAPAESAGNYIEYGVEALEEIMSVLEDGELLVIFAGYTEPMKRVFSSNEGFCRRVTHFFQFEDFSSKDLAEMLLIKMSKQDEKSRLYGFKLHPGCTLDAVVSVIERRPSEKMRNRMNGGLVDNMLNNARENLDSRLNFDSKGDELLTITLRDLEAGLEMLSKRMNLDGDEKKLDVGGEKIESDGGRRKAVITGFQQALVN